MTAKERYAEYLKTDYWKEVTAQVKKRAGWKCQICNSPHDLQAHHRTYENRGRELGHLDDLICMCRRCHGVFHGAIEVRVDPPSRIKAKKKKGRPDVDVSSEMPEGEGDIVLTAELVQRTRTHANAFTTATMRAYGLKRPVLRGWVARLEGQTISREQYREALIGKHWYGSGTLEKGT